MQDGLSYFSGVGRGKGTILPTPNLVPLFQNAAKQEQAAKAAQNKQLADSAKQMSDLADLGDKGFIEDYEYLSGIRDGFEKSVVDVYSKYNGAPPAQEVARLLNDKNKAMNQLQQSQKQGDEFYRWQHEIAKIEDPETRGDMIKLLGEWRDINPKDRPDLTGFINEKRFDYSKFTTGLASLVNKEALQLAKNSGIIQTPNGKFTDTKTYKYTTQPLAEKVVRDAYVTDPMYRRETNRLYEDFKKQYPTGEVEYVRYDKNQSGGVDAITEKAKVNNVDEFMQFVQAPALTSMQERENVQMSSSVSVGISNPVSAADALQEVGEFVVMGADGNQYGFVAESKNSINGFNVSKQPGGKPRTGSPFKGSYSTEKEKEINNAYYGDVMINDHYRAPIATEDILLDPKTALFIQSIDPNALTKDKIHLKKGTPIPTEFRDNPAFSGKTRMADLITYAIVTKYDADGNPTTQRQYIHDAADPQFKNWLNQNMVKKGGKDFTEWYFGWPAGKTTTTTTTTGSGSGTTKYGGKVR